MFQIISLKTLDYTWNALIWPVSGVAVGPCSLPRIPADCIFTAGVWGAWSRTRILGRLFDIVGPKLVSALCKGLALEVFNAGEDPVRIPS